MVTAQDPHHHEAVTQLDEYTVIKRAQKGDKGAFETLVRTHERRVYNVALQMLGNAQDAEDCTQDTFIKVYRYLPEYAARAKFSTWLYRVTINACTDFIRKRNRPNVVSIDQLQTDGYEWPAVALEQPDQVLLNAELRDQIRLCLAQLPEEYRSAVVLRDVQGLAYEEIAQVLRCSLGTVKSRINRGRHMLRDRIPK